MEKFPFPGTVLETFFPIWLSAQKDLSKVIRWKPRLNDGIAKKGMRRQNVLQHTQSFSCFAGTVLIEINEYFIKEKGEQLDLLLLERAFKWHDHAEGLKHRDIIGPLKKDQDDVDEYLAFMEHVDKLAPVVKKEYQYAFLLQFALDGNKLFPEEAQEIVDELKETRYFEAMLFKALEKFEYIFYPIEMRKKHKYLLTWLLRGILPRMQNCAKEIPGFREVVFTVLLEEQITDYLKAHEDVPDEIEFFKK